MKNFAMGYHRLTFIIKWLNCLEEQNICNENAAFKVFFSTYLLLLVADNWPADKRTNLEFGKKTQ